MKGYYNGLDPELLRLLLWHERLLPLSFRQGGNSVVSKAGICLRLLRFGAKEVLGILDVKALEQEVGEVGLS